MVPYTDFFRNNYSVVVAVAARRLSSISDAEDVAAEAFSICWSRYRVGEQLTIPWLFVVVKNLIGNEYKRRERQSALHERIIINKEITYSVPVPPPPEAHENILPAIDMLPEKYQEVIKMVYWDELSSKEVSIALHISDGAVRKRLSRARQLLREILGEVVMSQSDVSYAEL